jgi:dTDP-4-amino-4,6-dideoxygalactose transaminase
VVTTEKKEEFCQYLTDNNIIPAFHYPIPCHLQKAYSNLGHQVGDFPNSEYLATHCISLPMFAELTDEQVKHVINVINKY